MLSKDEELRLASFLGVLRHDVKEGLTNDPDIKLEAYLWLAEKLKECNNELKEIMNSAEKFQKLKVTRRDGPFR